MTVPSGGGFPEPGTLVADVGSVAGVPMSRRDASIWRHVSWF